MDDYISKAVTILDVGAGDGEFSLYCSKLNESVNIYAFESSSIMFELLQKKINDEKIHNITLLNYALGHKIGRAKMNKKDEYINIGGLYIKKNDEEVKIATMDSLNLTTCDIIKINTMEDHVLIGARQTLELFHPTIIFKNKTSIDFLKNMNYNIEPLGEEYMAFIT